ncbi:MAG: hypothetical protein JWQ98_355 [Chlorobi bacterium]|nr:hypothetical protein [Chlorobiota bacterium]
MSRRSIGLQQIAAFICLFLLVSIEWDVLAGLRYIADDTEYCSARAEQYFPRLIIELADMHINPSTSILLLEINKGLIMNALVQGTNIG